ncbi:MAG: hypothetical protein RLZZ401_1530 [Pseudomonadota bacterium]|jgi:Zn-dependent protease
MLPSLRRWLCLLSLAALLLMQQLGWAHRVTHGGLAGTVNVSVRFDAGTEIELAAHDASLCGVLDHLSLGAAAPAAALPIGCGHGPVPRIFLLVAGFIGARLALFEARGPPDLC